jgi:uncharacterized membrane protein YccC
MTKKILIYTSNIEETKASIRAGLFTVLIFTMLSIMSLVFWGGGTGFWIFAVIAMYFVLVIVIEYLNIIAIKRSRRKDSE